jgi:hypothetical protein
MNMSSPGNHPPDNKRGGKKGPQQKLRVLSEDGSTRPAAAGIAMPRARTDRSELLAGDSTLCVRRRAAATTTRQNAEACSGACGVVAEPQAEAPRTPTADGDLACVVDAWPGLPRNVRAAVLALIRETLAVDA